MDPGGKDVLALVPDMTALEEGRSTIDEALDLYRAAGWLWVVYCLPFFLVGFGIALGYRFVLGDGQPIGLRLVVGGLWFFPVACGLLSWTNYYRAKWLSRAGSTKGKGTAFRPLPLPWLGALTLTFLLFIGADLTMGR